MKVTLGTKEKFNGYVDWGLNQAFFTEVDDGECEEIRAVDICDYIHITQIEQFLLNLFKKTRKGGKLVIGGTDYLAVFLDNSGLTTGQVNNIFFNINSKPKAGLYTLDDIVDILDKLGMKITKKILKDYEYTVEAIRA